MMEWDHSWRSGLRSDFATMQACVGGCRCQALLLVGDATATDPVCSLAPAHHIVESALAEANSSAAVSKPVPASSFVQLQQRTSELWSYRTNPE